MPIIAQRFLSKEDFKWLKDNNYQYEIQKNNVIITKEGIEIPLKDKMESMLKERVEEEYIKARVHEFFNYESSRMQ